MKQIIKKHIINSRGKRLKERFLIIESDDWGAIRIPNKETRQVLWERNLTKKNDAFARFDSLESEKDYYALFDILQKYKDHKGNHPVITANFIINNPDFDAIKNENYQQYHSETFLKTYKRNPDSEKAENALQLGIAHKLFRPQFHGTEHLNVVRWMELLQKNDFNFRTAFDLSCYAIEDVSGFNRRANLMASYDYNSDNELEYIQKSIVNGLVQFGNIFGFDSQTTIAPCYVWNESIEETMKSKNVNCFQGSFLQNLPSRNGAFEKKYHFIGQHNDFDQTYLVRNALFEPSIQTQVDWVNKCLESINIAFMWDKPAIIGTHRINFVGRLDESQRDNNLKDLEALIKKVILKWPDVQFISSDQLYKIYI